MARLIWNGPKPGEGTLTVHVYITRRYRLRLFVAKLLLRLAARIARIRYQEHETDDDQEAQP